MRKEPDAAKAALYYWMSAFKESDPDVFGEYETAHAGDGKRNWYEHVRKALKASTAIEKSRAPAGRTYQPAARRAPWIWARLDAPEARSAADADVPQPGVHERHRVVEPEGQARRIRGGLVVDRPMGCRSPCSAQPA